jgi:hypothetical protein
MDVGFYLSELLEQVGEVSVPGLGYFVLARMSGYYDERENKFYPPYHQVQFDLQSIDDDALAQYIADKKNISLSSAKYFAEKYISSLKQEALLGEFGIANLGWFYTEQSQLAFRPSTKIPDDSAFYGYPPVEIYKLGHKPVIEDTQKPSYLPETTANPELAEDNAEEQEYIDLEEEPKRSLVPLIVTFSVIIVLALGIVAIYELYPSAFQKMVLWEKNITGVKTPVKPKVIAKPKVDTTAIDTADTPPIIKDSTAINKTGTKPDSSKVVQPVVDATKSHFEIIAISFKSMAGVNDQIKKFKLDGLDATISIDAPGPRTKISVGTYNTLAEAEAVRLKLIATERIPKSAHTVEIKPQQ